MIRAALTVLLLVVLPAATADAATLTPRKGGGHVLTGAPGERNEVEISPSGAGYLVRDKGGAPLSVQDSRCWRRRTS